MKEVNEENYSGKVKDNGEEVIHHRLYRFDSKPRDRFSHKLSPQFSYAKLLS